MLVGVFHTIWAHGRFQGERTCREVLTTGMCSPMKLARPSERARMEEFLATKEADESVSAILSRYGSRAE